jgi:hypothetical protein
VVVEAESVPPPASVHVTPEFEESLVTVAVTEKVPFGATVDGAPVTVTMGVLLPPPPPPHAVRIASKLTESARRTGRRVFNENLLRN